MQYNKQIDEIITAELLENGELGYNKLKSSVDGSLRKKLSYDTFSFHIKKLLAENTLSKYDTGKRGLKVRYSLTDDAKKKRQLQILGYDRNQLMRRKLYECILLFGLSGWTVMLKFNQIRSFLSELGIKLKDLKVKSIRHLPSEEEFHKYPDEIFVWTQTHYEPVKVAGYMEIEVWKNESVKPSITDGFGVRLPGFSKSEVLNRAGFGDLKPTSVELETAFDTLLKERIIRPISFMFRRETRYVIADDNLRAMIKDIWSIHVDEWFMLLQKWQYLEKPTEEEEKWLYWTWGEKEAKRFFQDAEISRHEAQKKRDMVVDIARKFVSKYQKKLGDKIRDFKIKHKKTLEQYSYLADIIRRVSPSLLE